MCAKDVLRKLRLVLWDRGPRAHADPNQVAVAVKPQQAAVLFRNAASAYLSMRRDAALHMENVATSVVFAITLPGPAPPPNPNVRGCQGQPPA